MRIVGMMEVVNPISAGEGCQTINIKRKKLKDVILPCNRSKATNIILCKLLS
jgi:hypothetical protein